MLRYLFLLLLFCLLSVVSASASQGSIFVYHRFGDARYPSTNIELKVFAAQLDYLIEQRIPVLPLSQVVTRLRRGAELPERYVVLTVDDGYASFLSGAMPLLRQRQLPVTLFVSSRSVGARGYLDWEQLRILQREGVE
ncbi:MAG: chitin deacetylase, partial [Desulfuromonas sp.]